MRPCPATTLRSSICVAATFSSVDLNSTNGSFIIYEKITEQVLKPGQTLRLGQVELKLEADGAAGAASGTSATSATTPGGTSAPAPAPAKKQVDATMLIPRGVSLEELETGARKTGFDKTFFQEGPTRSTAGSSSPASYSGF